MDHGDRVCRPVWFIPGLAWKAFIHLCFQVTHRAIPKVLAPVYDGFLFTGTPSHSPSRRTYLTRSIDHQPLSWLPLSWPMLCIGMGRNWVWGDAFFPLMRDSTGVSHWHSYFIEVNLQFPFAISAHGKEAGNCTHSQLQWILRKTSFFQIPSGFYPHFLEGWGFLPV